MAEYKYDGERAQVQLAENGKVYLFSRRAEPLHEKYPEVVAYVRDVVRPAVGAKSSGHVTSFILDCEIVAVDDEIDSKTSDDGQPRLLPFQLLTRRRRKQEDGAPRPKAGSQHVAGEKGESKENPA